jgi:hypothetical protein
MKSKCSCSLCDAHHSVDSGKESINEAGQGGKPGQYNRDPAIGNRESQRFVLSGKNEENLVLGSEFIVRGWRHLPGFFCSQICFFLTAQEKYFLFSANLFRDCTLRAAVIN